ncbi:MAG TPA: SDR family NAD(P)-dependent oxidoreductase, partial [Candidatus Limnocylindrales bacterium]|nr:SDR family NAD(P)-dependent oxidoreductase [Candidatus Limnocylindrales bacterium]
MTRVVAITGIAGGIGSATAAAFHAAGWTVVGADLVDPSSSTPLDGFRKVDLRAPEVGDTLATFFAELPSLDALVNAAAAQGTDTIEATSVTAWSEVLDGNARG